MLITKGRSDWITTMMALLSVVVDMDGHRLKPIMNNLLTQDVSLPQCQQSLQLVKEAEQLAYTPYPPDTKGTWVSQECETRPGPEFILRHYYFERDRSFKLLQHFYGDEWCTTPLYTLSAKGQLHLRERSWIVPGAADADYTLYKVNIIAYSNDILDEIIQRVNRTCPGYINRPWRVHKEYVIYSYSDDKERDRELIKRHSNGSTKKITNDLRSKRVSHNGSHYQPDSSKENAEDGFPQDLLDDVDCLDAFHAIYHELQLIRSSRKIQDITSIRVSTNKKDKHNTEDKLQTYLFLGDIHPQLEHRASYRPTSYQAPLVRPNEAVDCYVCRAVAKSSEKSPPHLHARPRLPVYPVGDWISTTCETRPIGNFLLRRIHFFESNNGFHGFYSQSTFQALFHYYSDPACSKGTYSLLIAGHYTVGSDSSHVQGGTEFDFYIQSASITVHDESTARNLNGLRGNECGKDGSWKVGLAQDITNTGGCLGLGIRVPSLAKDLLKMDLDHLGQPLLHFGIMDNRMAEDLRPTAYQPALRQCTSYDQQLINDVSNDLPLIPHARIALSKAVTHTFNAFLLLLLTIAVTSTSRAKL